MSTSRKPSSHLNNYTGISTTIFILYQPCSYSNNPARTPTFLLILQNHSSHSNITPHTPTTLLTLRRPSQPPKKVANNKFKQKWSYSICLSISKKTTSKNTTKPPKNTNRTNYWENVFFCSPLSILSCGFEVKTI